MKLASSVFGKPPGHPWRASFPIGLRLSFWLDVGADPPSPPSPANKTTPTASPPNPLDNDCTPAAFSFSITNAFFHYSSPSPFPPTKVIEWVRPPSFRDHVRLHSPAISCVRAAAPKLVQTSPPTPPHQKHIYHGVSLSRRLMPMVPLPAAVNLEGESPPPFFFHVTLQFPPFLQLQLPQ